MKNLLGGMLQTGQTLWVFVILMLNTKVNGVGVEELILLDLFV
jgi:hypothetical protein